MSKRFAGVVCLAVGLFTAGCDGANEAREPVKVDRGDSLGAATRTSWTAVTATQPGASQAGAMLATVRVAITDNTNTTVPTSTLPVTLSVVGNTATLGGTTTVNAVDGVAVFTDLVFVKSGSYRLIAAAPGMTSATSGTFTISPAAPDRLEFSVPPSNVNAGALFAPAVQVSVLDVYGNLATAPTSVVLSLQDNPGSSTLSGTLTLNTTTGRATFSTLRLNRPGTGYTLKAVATGLPTLVSGEFDVLLGAATRLLVVSGSGQSANVGTALTFPLVVESQDAVGNVVPNVLVSWVWVTGSGSVTGAAQTDAAGRAQASVTLGTASGAQRIEAQSAGLTTAAFTATARALAASQLLVVSGDGQRGVVDSTLAAPLVVSTLDVYGNPVANQIVTFTGTGCSVSAAAPRTSATGVASVTVRLGTVSGNGTCVVQALRSGLGGSPATFIASADPGPLTQLSFVQSPADAEVAAPLVDARVRALDAFGNQTAGGTVGVSLAGGTSGATLSGVLEGDASGGEVTFAGLTIDRPGAGYTLVATSGAVSGSSAAFSISCASGLTACNGACVDVVSDVNHCGACGTTCSGSQASAMACVGGQCAVAACQPSWGNCDANAANGCETSLVSNTTHCGACGRTCAAGQSCRQGMCGGVDDAQTAFSSTANPNGPWSYGKKSTSGFVAFTAASTDGAGNEEWNDGVSSEPAVLFNRTGAPTSVRQGVLPAGELALVPGASEAAVLRYTAPAAGTYRVYLDFEGLVHTTKSITLSDTRYRQTWYCRDQFIFCGNYNPTPRTNSNCGCDPRFASEPFTQTQTVTVPLHSTPEFELEVNGESAWGPGSFVTSGRSDGVSFAWGGGFQWLPTPPFSGFNYRYAVQYYSWAEPQESRHRGASVVELGAGDTLDVVVGAGGYGNEGDLTRVRARVELACAPGLRDCDGDPSNGCEADISVSGTCDVTLVSKTTRGFEMNGNEGTVSNDGRLSVFVGVVNGGVARVYLRDRISGTTTAVDQVPGGGLPDRSAVGTPRLTPDGRFILFHSHATNLVQGDTNGVDDLFIVDRANGLVERVSTGALGQANSSVTEYDLSDDGRWVAWTSYASNLVADDTNGVVDLFIKDRASGELIRVVGPSGEAVAGLGSPRLSADGMFVAFYSNAANLDPLDTNNTGDTFVFDVAARTVRRLVTASGDQLDTTSNPVAMGTTQLLVQSQGGNTGCAAGGYAMVDLSTHAFSCLVVGGTQTGFYALDLSADGRWVLLTTPQALTAEDTDADYDVYSFDRLTLTSRLLSAENNSHGARSSYSAGRLSANGRFLALSVYGHSLTVETGALWNHTYVAPVLREAEVTPLSWPSVATAGASFSIGSVLSDERGERVRLTGAPVTLEVASGPAGHGLAAQTLATVGGATTFPLTVNLAGTYTFTLSAPNFAARTFGPITVGAGAAANLVVVSGDAQEATVGASLAPLVVRLSDALGNPIAGQTVTWAVAQGTGTLTPATALTDANGEASAVATLSTVSGSNAFTASVGSQLASFSAQGRADAPVGLVWLVQPPTAVTAGVVFAPAPSIALVDTWGNLVDNVSASVDVAWSLADLDFDYRYPTLRGTTNVAFTGGVAVLSGLYANEAWTSSIRATSGAFSTLSNELTVTAGPVDGNTSSLSASPSTAEANQVDTVVLLVVARDQFGNRIGGALPDFQVSGSGNQLSALDPTNSNGNTTATLTSSRAQTKVVNASVNGVPLATTVQVLFTPLSNCAPDTSDCNGDALDGCESDLTALTSCGACGTVCGGDMLCTGGVCECPASTPNACGSGPTGTCANFANDLANCGGCGVACAAGEACTAQGCTPSCTDSLPADDVVALELEPTGANLVPGTHDTLQFKAFARKRRAPWQRVDVTAQATFTTSNASIVDVTTGGLASSPAATTGTETITATIDGVTATARLRVWDATRFAQLQALTLNAPGFGMYSPIGSCFPISCMASFSDGSSEDVSETTDFAVVGLGAAPTSPRVVELRVLDQNLLTVNGGALQDPNLGRYTDLVAQLVPGGIASPRLTAYVGGAGGSCADSRSPGPRVAVAPFAGSLTLYTNETVALRTVALESDFSIREVSAQAQLETCNPAAVHAASDGWLTGLAPGTAVVSSTVGALSGQVQVAVGDVFPAAGALRSLRLRPGAANVEPGQPFALRAVARYQNSGTRLFNVTPQTSFTSSDPSLASFVAPGRGQTGTTLGTADVTASLSGLTTSGSVRLWPVGRLGAITGATVVRTELYQQQGTCQPLKLRLTFNGDPLETEDITRDATWWQDWDCFGDVSPTGVFWARGPYCTSGAYLDVQASMGFGLAGGRTVVNSSPINGMADDYRDPVTCN